MTLSKQDESGRTVVLGEHLDLDSFVAIARHNTKISISDDYKNRVCKSRDLVEKWVDEERVMYGITTGFGALSTTSISKEDVSKLQKNILFSHATSVGAPLSIEDVRSIMLMMLQNIGQGYSGVRLCVLEHIVMMLNEGLIPYAPGDGSVGYLSVEAHLGLAFIGKGKLYYRGKLYETEALYKELNIEPLVLREKEGLALISGSTSPTGIGALAIYDINNSVKSADIIAAMNLEVSKGTIKAFDARLMSVKNHKEQTETASIIRDVLSDSELAIKNIDYRLQDALSLRAVPQLHGASKRTIADAIDVIEQEMNMCSDNPVVWSDDDDGIVLSGCHCDSSYVGLELDSSCIAATMVAKMSERRNFRLTTGTHSELPWFLIKNPGVNSGLMIPQYTQAGLLNEMRLLSQSSVIDNVPTCGGQEDYVAMGYNSARKAKKVANKLNYILAIELLSVYQSYQFLDETYAPGTISKEIIAAVSKFVPHFEVDHILHPYIEQLKQFIEDGKIIDILKIIGR